MVMLPREHGAYGQCAVPLITAFAVAGLSQAGLLVATTVIAAFLAHEPAAIVLGARGRRLRVPRPGRAAAWLCGLSVLAAASALGALLLMPAATRWSLAVPAVPAALLLLLTTRRREKSTAGEVLTAVAFTAAALPVVLAGGASLPAAVTVAVPLAAFFVTATLAVRVVIVSVRAGGDPRAARILRSTVFAISAAVFVLVTWGVRTGMLPFGAVTAAAPGLTLAVLIAARPPRPVHLRRIGWTLVGASAVTAILCVRAIGA